jgi:hypothetical protein
MTQLTDHFTLDELIASPTAAKRGIANIPSDEEAAYLMGLCTLLLEPIRGILNLPMQINSGYRCPALNAAVGGVMNSAHMDGRAADFIVPGTDLNLAWDQILQNSADLPFDQLIWERNGLGSQWIHIAVAKDGDTPRGEVLRLFQGDRKAKG